MKVVWSIVAAVLIVGTVGCQKSTDGSPVRAESADSTTRTTSSTSASASVTAAPTTEPPVPGVVTTLPDTVPPNALVCLQDPNSGTGTPTTAQVADPAAPRIVIVVPTGWTATPGEGDTALTLTGPEGMSGKVTIAETTLDPAAAFDKYGDDAMAAAPVSVLNTLPADFCGYSGQRLMGTWSETPDGTIDYADLLTHIWTNTKDYMVAIHVQGPDGANGFDAAETTLTSEYSITIP